MSTYTLKVPSSQTEKDWFHFINQNLQYTEEVSHLIVDFNDVKFMDTDDFVLLACLIESFYIKDCTIEVIGGSKKFNSHLNNIKFKQYWKDGFDRTKFTPAFNQSTLCLWKISQGMIYSYSNYARKYFERFAENKDLIPLASNMDEIFNNIFDHSKSLVTGYIITQYYPKSNKISFSVCDFGIGIPTSIKQSNLNDNFNNEDWKAISKALEEGFSVKSTPQNRGFGLNNILRFTESSNGSLKIISNNGFVEKVADKMYKMGKTDYNFSGTLIKVEVDLTTFEEKDDEEMIFDF